MTVVYFGGDEVPNDQKDQKNTAIVKIGKEEDPWNHRSAILTSGPAKMIEQLGVISQHTNAKTAIDNRQHLFAIAKSWLDDFSVFWN